MADEAPTARAQSHAPPVVGAWTLWFAVLGGLGAWLARLIAGASLVGYACEAGATGHLVLYGLSVAAILHTLFALGLCQRIRRRATNFPDDTQWQAADFSARVGVLVNVIALALIVAESSFIPFVGPCAFP